VRGTRKRTGKRACERSARRPCLEALPDASLPVAAVTTGFRYVEWSPVILGTLAASAISIVLLTFGAARGHTGVSPYPYAGLSAKALAVLSATYAALVVAASFGAGGYLAGRTRNAWAGGNIDEAHFRDGAHGFAVWALSVVVGGVVAD
jgi:hypothetical protein